ncbi:MAG: undecaprenyldiphospho-muramoylpentapeptide beta-N-acetylglucosaminyltransferase [Porticoccaceae bacterium]|jgi:UDP-N-acetylglucosamine--N-acetylmuramyl-(pentapeptide) pyrophosphoryl-undecaprenol N-acetylglucosamine transferase|tara:strand:- start:1806 stop:2906 length:1101 start_codon:yes stop_codon:yes gene_type:complete
MSADKQLRVMIMAGGTGGHVFPALAVADQLRSGNAEISWLGTRAGIEADLIPKQNITLNFIDIEGVRGRGLLALLKAPLLLWRSIAQALAVLSDFRPQVVLGMGGFASGPGAVAAWLKRIPVVIHEQNSVAGTTNRLTAIVAKRVMQGFPNTLPKGEWCGNPVRTEISELAPPDQRFAGRSGKLRLLIVGGSRGALAINTLLPRALAEIDPALRPEILHQTGRAHWQQTIDLYDDEALGLADSELSVVPFIDAMEKAYEWADFVVCRAGALTVAELTSAGLGALLIPFPFAIDDHQTANGQMLVDHGAAEMIQQSALTAANLAAIIVGIAADPDRRLAMAMSARALAKNQAVQDVANVCREVACGQ